MKKKTNKEKPRDFFGKLEQGTNEKGINPYDKNYKSDVNTGNSLKISKQRVFCIPS
jgi:hypothetical protein